MQLPRAFDPEFVTLMSGVCCDAWWELKASNQYPSIAAEHAARNLMALGVMEAVGKGQRDPGALRKIAVECGAMPLERSAQRGLDGSRVDSPAKVRV